MTREWFIFYGHMLNMPRQETMLTRYGEMIDMISCLAVYHGGAEIDDSRSMTFDEVMALE